MTPYRTPADETATQSIPHGNLGRIANAFGLSDYAFVRRWLGGRWERWELRVIHSGASIWFRVIEWTDATNIEHARDRHSIRSNIWISREDWSIAEIEEWP